MRRFILPILLLTSCAVRKLSDHGMFSTVPNGKLFASLYQQKACEYRALCFQAYNLARMRLDQYNQRGGKPKAIIADIDETVLDNSPYEIHQALQGKDYEDESWFEWTRMASADTVPGAPSFLKYASSKGVRIFYITNRYQREKDATIQNLLKYHLPDADKDHVLTKQTESSKESRRKNIMDQFDVLLLLGDNLADFSTLFDVQSYDKRLENANLSEKEFGDHFIVLPNTVYGDWESVLYNFNYSLNPSQKDSIIRYVLKSY